MSLSQTSLNARYKPGGSEFEGTGTATPADQRYLEHQRYEDIECLPQHEAPDPSKYTHIETEYEAFLHEMTIATNYPRLKYRIRDEQDKRSVIHHGQLKLLLSEIRFLTEYNELAPVVIYAGAAPGHHIAYLSSLFPSHTFELYDPCEFSDALSHHAQITCHREYFTNDLATQIGEKYAESGVLFMCDIRTADHR